jgi:hypothetical protein
MTSWLSSYGDVSSAMSSVSAPLTLLSCDSRSPTPPATALEVDAPCEDALEDMFDEDIAADEVLFESVDNLAMSPGGLGGLGGGVGAAERIGVCGGEM